MNTLGKRVISAVGVEELRRNMTSLFGQLRDMLQPETGRIGVIKVDSVELYVQITGQGKICILRRGATVGAEGGLKLVLKLAE